MQLRPYQSDLIKSVRVSLMRGNRSVCVVSGCGSGKSVVAASIALSATHKHNRVLFLVHRVELCEQIRDTFTAYGVDMALCDINMVQTARRRLKTMPKDYAVIIIDEAHTNYDAYQKISAAYQDAVKIGFTATPVRLNEGGLGLLFQDIVTSVSTEWLIENHYLSDYKYYSIPLADTNGLHVRAGEYKQDEVNALMEHTAVYTGAVQQYRRLADGKKAMIYCSSIKASIETVEAFRTAGINAVHIDGSTPKRQREAVIERYRAGEITVLSNVGITNEGFDDKDIECVILLRPTLSLSLYIQMSMRSMRYKPGKTAIVIDCVGSCYLHGLPSSDRKWTLQSKKKQENTVKVRECSECFAVVDAKYDVCPYCGAVLKKEVVKKNKKAVEVDLVEVSRQKAIKDTKLRDADLRTWNEVVEFQKIHKYRFAWCLHYAENYGIDIPKKYNYMRKKFIKG